MAMSDTSNENTEPEIAPSSDRSQLTPTASVPEDNRRGPIVFISYSHDSKEHKAWVAGFARRLVDKGVDLLFDQWDLGPGDDVPKFMERAVATANRVLMICTEPYVRKADDGKGGVGYEAMVVTGELVRDLGTNKFIPIVRQTSSPWALPRCVSTRFYVDLSEGAETDENFEMLLREIHDTPKLVKPPLGRNPFAAAAFEGPEAKVVKTELRLEFSDALTTPEGAYSRALRIIQTDDRVAWRKLLLAAAEFGAQGLNRWRVERPDIPSMTDKDQSARFEHVRAGVEPYAPMIACLAAAAESGKAGYADQLGWVEAILNPAGYEKGGTVYHATFPQTIFFVTQALVGGMLMLSGAGDTAYQLAVTKVPDQFQPREALPLFSMTRFNGWPETLEHTCTVGWGFLNSLVSSWGWLQKAYGGERECRSGITAYYQLLSFLNFLKLAKAEELDSAMERQLGKFPVTAPLCFCVGPEDIVTAGYKCFLKQAPILRKLLDTNKVDQVRFEMTWEKWMAVAGNWLAEVYRNFWPSIHTPQRNLPKDMNTNPYSLE
jgi:hypothetical protein